MVILRTCIKFIIVRAPRAAQGLGALRHSSRGVTTDPGSIPGCVAAGCGRETHEAVCQEAWQGRVSEDAWLLTFASPESVRELQLWDKAVTTNWGEKGVKSL
jgi:hypothetical protein